MTPQLPEEGLEISPPPWERVGLKGPFEELDGGTKSGQRCQSASQEPLSEDIQNLADAASLPGPKSPTQYEQASPTEGLTEFQELKTSTLTHTHMCKTRGGFILPDCSARSRPWPPPPLKGPLGPWLKAALGAADMGRMRAELLPSRAFPGVQKTWLPAAHEGSQPTGHALCKRSLAPQSPPRWYLPPKAGRSSPFRSSLAMTSRASCLGGPGGIWRGAADSLSLRCPALSLEIGYC